MGTLCRNCPFKDIHQKTGEVCTTAFIQKYKNSCMILDIAEQTFMDDLKKYSKEVKKEEAKKEATKAPKKVERKPRTPRTATKKSQKQEEVKVEEENAVIEEEIKTE